MRTLIFSLTLLLSSFLLFLVQPMIGRMLLPSLGGTPAVWNGCMLFFQAALLGGYGWAHYGPPKLGVRTHLLLHLALLGGVCCVLPIQINESWPAPVDSNPTFWLLGQLTMCVGLPFFVVSSSAPLLQRWFSLSTSADAPAGDSEPWFLYAISNVGSLVALLSYPFVFERIMGLTDQGMFWASGFIGLTVMFCICGWYTLKNASESSLGVPTDTKRSPPIAWRSRLHYIALAAIPSSLMLGVTTIVSTDAGSFPLMWSIPLALYLLTFVFVFAKRQLIPHRLVIRALPYFMLAMPVILALDLGSNAALMIGFHFLTFFVVSMACHGELARLRPPVSQLTEFYLMMSIGGVVGGAFNSLLAPVIFNSILEYPLALLAACLVVPRRSLLFSSTKQDTSAVLNTSAVLANDVSILSIKKMWAAPVALLAIIYTVHTFKPQLLACFASSVMLLGFCIPAVVCFYFSASPKRFTACFAVLLLGFPFVVNNHGATTSERGFFGVNEVTLYKSDYRMLINGRTTHGLQRVDEMENPQPLSYYHRTGPVGDIFRVHGDRQDRVAVVGLGIGTIAAYGQPHQQFEFYEIDPIVYKFASDERYFTYLREAKSEVNVVLGDARVQLAAKRQQQSQLTQVAYRSGAETTASASTYGLMILDAFGSDTVPVHLLTLEAVKLYFDVLDEDGLLAVHISSKFMDLIPIGAAIRDKLNLHAAARADLNASKGNEHPGKNGSHYMIFSRNKEVIDRHIQLENGWKSLTPEHQVLWTDEHANILDVMRW